MSSLNWIHDHVHRDTILEIEISRLQNSITHLKRTQDELKDYMEDPDIRQAAEENVTTMHVLRLLVGVYQRS